MELSEAMAVGRAAAREVHCDRRREQQQERECSKRAGERGARRQKKCRDSELSDREQQRDPRREPLRYAESHDRLPAPLAIGQLRHRGDHKHPGEQEAGREHQYVEHG